MAHVLTQEFRLQPQGRLGEAEGIGQITNLWHPAVPLFGPAHAGQVLRQRGGGSGLPRLSPWEGRPPQFTTSKWKNAEPRAPPQETVFGGLGYRERNREKG